MESPTQAPRGDCGGAKWKIIDTYLQQQKLSKIFSYYTAKPFQLRREKNLQTARLAQWPSDWVSVLRVAGVIPARNKYLFVIETVCL